VNKANISIFPVQDDFILRRLGEGQNKAFDLKERGREVLAWGGQEKI